MIKTVSSAAILLAAMSGAASAADLIDNVAPVVVDEALFDWTGFYIGVRGGYAAGTVRIQDGYCVQWDECGYPGSRYYADLDLSGWEAGGHVGAAVQYDSIVLGVETDLNWSGVRGEGGYTYYNAEWDEEEDGNPLEWAELDLLWEGSAVAKIGFAVDRFMPYALAGIAYGQADLHTHREFGPENGRHEIDFYHPTANLLGYTVGVGGAYAVTDNIILNGEARYTQYGDVWSHAEVPNDGEQALIEDLSLFRVQGGVSFKF